MDFMLRSTMNRETLTFLNEQMTKATNLQFRKTTLITTGKIERVAGQHGGKETILMS